MSTFAPLSPDLASFLDADTPEAKAHAALNDPLYMWDYLLPGVFPSLDEQVLALSAAYIALNRYIHGQDLYIVPTTVDELEQALRRYSADAIHNYVAKSRSPLNPGGYTRISEEAGASIMSLLSSPHNVERLLSLHRSRPTRSWSTRSKRNTPVPTPNRSSSTSPMPAGAAPTG